MGWFSKKTQEAQEASKETMMEANVRLGVWTPEHQTLYDSYGTYEEYLERAAQAEADEVKRMRH